MIIIIITALRQQAAGRGRPGDGAAHRGREGPPDDYNNNTLLLILVMIMQITVIIIVVVELIIVVIVDGKASVEPKRDF